MNALNARLRHHVTGAIERGEATAIVEQRRELYVETRWEMYELPSGASAGIGIRNKATQRKVAHIPPGPHDLEAARLIEAAPQLLDELESLLRRFDDGSNAPGFRAAREAVARARGNSK